MSFDFKKINYQGLGYFRFKKLGKDYLLTNETGDYVFLTKENFNKYLLGKLDKKTNQYKELSKKNLIGGKIKIDAYIEKYRQKNQYLSQPGPSLHIIVVTLRCNHHCVYCQASSVGPAEKDKDLDIKTAKKIVDLIFQSRNPFLAIEFQGGEPLFNWLVVKFIIDYALEKNKKEKRNLEIRLVSNFSLLTEEKANYLLEKKVILCTSLDGPEKIHNKNRIWTRGNSYEFTTKWLKKLLKRYNKYYINQPAALTTITRYSLPYYKEIIDEYMGLGISSIFLRPLSPLGVARKSWKEIGYTPEEFLEFYKKGLDYIFDLNIRKKIRFREMTAAYMAAKIFTKIEPNYFELRSPCGAGIGQLLYNYNGDIYTCDEGRMIKEDIFKIGNVWQNKYEAIVAHPTVRSMCLASCLDNSACTHCVYKPYCGVCPILNYVEFGNIFPQLPNSSRCKINKGTLDFLFSKVKNDRIKEVLKGWTKKRHQGTINN